MDQLIEDVFCSLLMSKISGSSDMDSHVTEIFVLFLIIGVKWVFAVLEIVEVEFHAIKMSNMEVI